MKKTFTYCDLCKKRKKISICPLCRKEICKDCSYEIHKSRYSELYICKSHMNGVFVPLDIIRRIYANSDGMEGWYHLIKYNGTNWLAVYTTDDGEISIVVEDTIGKLEDHELGSLGDHTSWECSFIHHAGDFYHFEYSVNVVLGRY